MRQANAQAVRANRCHLQRLRLGKGQKLMSLIRFGAGSQLYIYADVNGGYTCCGCALDIKIVNVPTIEELKEHLIRHKQAHHGVGIAGDLMTYQSYDQLFEAIDNDDF